MPTIYIDQQPYEVEAGENILQACLNLGLDLPYFCWHPAMGSLGACRQCAVVQFRDAEDKRGRIVMGCMTPVTDGARFSINGEKASQFRQTVVESLMVNHPHDCPVCGEGGECHLQDMTVMTGHRDRQYRGSKITHRNQYLGPLLHHEMNRCITCYRCTRYYQDYAGGKDLAAMAAHDHVYFGRHQPGVLESEFAGNLVEVCPTGVFTDKSLVHDYTRKWDLQSAPSVCVGCGVGCNTLPGERYGRLKRIHNRYNAEVNGYFLCDRGRFGGAFVNHPNKLDFPARRNEDGSFDAIAHHAAIEIAAQLLNSEGRIAAIGSPRASLEANFLLRQLAGSENTANGMASWESALVTQARDILLASPARIASLADIESADAVIILGEDVTNTAPRVALALRQAVRNKAFAMAEQLKLERWQDTAIRNLAQDERSPLFNLVSGDTPLDDIARNTVYATPETIEQLALEIRRAIVRGETGEDARVAEIAGALRRAKRPLVVSGTGAQHAGLLHAAAELSRALADFNPDAMLTLAVPECNSLGATLLDTEDSPSLETLAARAAAGEIDTLVILENDLPRRCDEATLSRLLTVPRRIVMEHWETPTVANSNLALPATSFAEGEGTFVNSEGRAQRFFPVFPPAEERQPAWAWLLAIGHRIEHRQFSNLRSCDEVTAACAASNALLQAITEAAPDHTFRNHGLKVPRQPHRYSGRTAMRAAISVHEPQRPDDEETALAFSMEGLNRGQGGSLLPFVWSPGWNSNQAVHKFQAEVGGHLQGGTAGVRLLDNDTPGPAPGQPTADAVSGAWRLIPRYRIFGSEETSVLSPSIAELAGEAYCELNESSARELGVATGDGLILAPSCTLEVRINASIPDGCIAYTVGYPETLVLGGLQATDVAERSSDWLAKPQLIGSDRGWPDA